GADAGEVGLLRAGGVGGDAVEVEPSPGREHGGGELRLRVRPPEVGTLVGDSLEPPGADLAAGEARPEALEAHGEGAAGPLAHADVLVVEVEPLAQGDAVQARRPVAAGAVGGAVGDELEDLAGVVEEVGEVAEAVLAGAVAEDEAGVG